MRISERTLYWILALVSAPIFVFAVWVLWRTYASLPEGQGLPSDMWSND